MQGGSIVEFTNRPGECYDIGMPNIYARGILFGTMVMELGDKAVVRCEKTDLVCEIEFKTKVGRKEQWQSFDVCVCACAAHIQRC